LNTDVENEVCIDTSSSAYEDDSCEYGYCITMKSLQEKMSTLINEVAWQEKNIARTKAKLNELRK
jgi:hypothetical protein